MTRIRRFSRGFVPIFVSLLLPAVAQAHDAGLAVSGWRAGFDHPLHGWDHLVVMLAVGLWASLQRGRARWGIPLAFVIAMAAGGLLGAAGPRIAAADAVVLLSVMVFAGLLLLRVRAGLAVGMAVAALAALAHGYVHCQEMPNAANLATFGTGFLVATIFLHAAGYAVARLAMTAGTLLAVPQAYAQSTAEAGKDIAEITVYGRQDSLVGIAESASQGTVGAVQLRERPAMRTGEVLETIPGVIITQHAGGGKANQYFLRGFNLDHGTDFATSLDGMPVNLPTHGHGQGYSDLNFIIPELIQRIDYQKGVYAARNGDFSSAGAAHMESVKTLDHAFAQVEGGMYGYGRVLGAGSTSLGAGEILAAADVTHADGPWARPDDFRKLIGVLTYSQGGAAAGFSVTARAYKGIWNSSDQVADSAIASGLVPFYGSLDGTTGGRSQRYSLQGEWHRAGGDTNTRVSGYAFYYDLDLFSNFTYFLTDPVRGDQFAQRDKRVVAGFEAAQTWRDDWGGVGSETTVGVQARSDDIHNGLFQTQARRRVIKINGDDGSLIPDVTRQDTVRETSLGGYAENTLQWAPKVRSTLGVREDVFAFDVATALAANTGRRTAAITSPKMSLVFGPWSQTEVYLQAGLGYHSNDARGVLTHRDPVSGAPADPSDPLVRSAGAEVGVRTEALPGLRSTVSLWWLNLDSELVFSGDGGTTEPSRPSRRYGIELANYYTPAPWISFDLDVALSHGEFRDADAAGRRIPESIQSVVAAGVTARDLDGFSASLRLRYFGPRPLIEDNSFRSGATILLNGQASYALTSRISITVDVFNILGRRDHDIDYAYESRVSATSPAITQVHFHPVEPRRARLTVGVRF